MRPSLRRNHKKQAPAKQLSSTIEAAVMPQLIKTIALLRAEIVQLKAELEELKLSSVRAAAKKITYRNGIQQ